MNLHKCPHPEKISDYENGKIIFRDFRKFIQNNTFNQDLKENILDFTDFAVNSSYKINTNSTERQITNFLKAALQNNIIQEIC